MTAIITALVAATVGFFAAWPFAHGLGRRLGYEAGREEVVSAEMAAQLDDRLDAWAAEQGEAYAPRHRFEHLELETAAVSPDAIAAAMQRGQR